MLRSLDLLAVDCGLDGHPVGLSLAILLVTGSSYVIRNILIHVDTGETRRDTSEMSQRVETGTIVQSL